MRTFAIQNSVGKNPGRWGCRDLACKVSTGNKPNKPTITNRTDAARHVDTPIDNKSMQ